MIIQGDALTVLKSLKDQSVNCCVTSPPYWGLRDYGTAKWEGGDPNCDHLQARGSTRGGPASTITGGQDLSAHNAQYKNVCLKCGAIRVDSQLGLEPTPEEYVKNLVDVFREVKRVLRDDGTLWLNLGDSYCGGGRGSGYSKKQDSNRGTVDMPRSIIASGLKPKDLVGIPWMVAFALRADGWYLRQDIIWSKPNPMPESVKDRCTKSHEYIFLLSKSSKYYFDAEAISEPQTESTKQRAAYGWNGRTDDGSNGARSGSTFKRMAESGEPIGTIPPNGMRNKRDVWVISTQSFKDAHFATFPPELIRPCVLAGCPKGGIVLDPFFGAGTTGLVALQEQRDYIGIELNADYIKIAEKRLSGVQIKL